MAAINKFKISISMSVRKLKLATCFIIFTALLLPNIQCCSETDPTSTSFPSHEDLRSLGDELALASTSAYTSTVETATTTTSAPSISNPDGNLTPTPTTEATPTTDQTSTTSASVPQPDDEPTSQEPSSTVVPTTTPEAPVKCMDDNYCLNGGTCIISRSGQMECICPDNFYGARCQTRNICKTIIVASMTGDQICAKIGRECYKNDKFFRCSCHDDEYFVFKANGVQFGANDPFMSGRRRKPRDVSNRTIGTDFMPNDLFGTSTEFAFAESSGPTKNGAADRIAREPIKSNQAYLAECYKIDKCLGVMCRRLSEVCVDGECVCNQDLGYMRHPNDGLCQLVNPCMLPAAPGESSICGEAQCVATYDNELFKCVCPIGYKPLKIGAHKNSTQCVPVDPEFTVCDVPLLNKCQHICRIDRGSRPRCSCLNGYNPGTRIGIDDHMCFFDENVGKRNFHDDSSMKQRDTKLVDPELPSSTESSRLIDGDELSDFIYRKYIIPRRPQQAMLTTSSSDKTGSSNTFTYDPLSTISSIESTNDDFVANSERYEACDTCESPRKKIKSEEFYIRREPRPRNAKDRSQAGDEFGFDSGKLSPQHRCNNFCEENKICVLESGSTDSYRCVCDRQGYVSVGDRCLDWCAAVEFSFRVRGLLENVCLSGVCKPTELRPPYVDDHLANDESTKLAYDSSWRPEFACDCSSSPLLVQDPVTKLCKLDFEAILNPCKPGNVGYVDCVENKNAYCSVLHKPTQTFIKSLLKERPGEMGLKGQDDITGGGPNKASMKAKDKMYTCVCSPEKKFLVDKPRNKATCVDECELLNVECGRFNRMCRKATIAPEDFAAKNLIRFDPDGIRMNFKRTGCECLPGFNVGPEGLVDFTLEDNNQDATLPAVVDLEAYSQIPSLLNNNNDPNLEKENSRAKYINIKSLCFLDYDVVEFRAKFRAPPDFDPSWIPVRDAPTTSKTNSKPGPNNQIQDRIRTMHQSTNNHQTMESGQQSIDGTNEATENNMAPSGDTIEKTARSASSDSFHSDGDWCKNGECILKPPAHMDTDISKFNKEVVLVAQCDPAMAPLSIDAYQKCIKYRYWIVHKFRNHFIDWRRIVNNHLSKTFDLMDGNIRVHVNKCEASVRSVSHDRDIPSRGAAAKSAGSVIRGAKQKQSEITTADQPEENVELSNLITDPQVYIDADIECELTLHTANDGSSPRKLRKVLLEKQLQKFIFVKPDQQFGNNYYLMAPNMLIRRETFDQLADHRLPFTPCKSSYAYCDKQTKCEPVDPVNFTCTCETGYTPIGSRDIYKDDSRREVCEDIDECLFDVCKELANVSTCQNTIGDYKCVCNRHYTGDNKRYCTHVCNTIPCQHGKCRLVDDHHAFCECDDGYKETDCSVQDPNVALRKANMIICGAIFTSVLLLAITFAISLNSQLKKTKKKLKRLEAAEDAARMFDFTQQPFRTRVSSKVSSN